MDVPPDEQESGMRVRQASYSYIEMSDGLGARARHVAITHLCRDAAKLLQLYRPYSSGEDTPRIQVLSVSDTGRRRRWTDDENIRIAEESRRDGAAA